MRFLGRRVYLGVVVVLATVLAHGLTGKRLRRLQEQISDSLSEKTIKRWRTWWREVFPGTGFWQRSKALLPTPPEIDRLPKSLIEQFVGDDLEQRVRSLLHFILPLTSSLSEQPR